MSESRDYDIVIFGATSFVGNIMARYMAISCNNTPDKSSSDGNSLENPSPENSVNWAIAGRSRQKLEALQSDIETLSNGQSKPDILVAEADDREALLHICEKTKVIVSTVGPFALYGETLVACCADSGTDYCDSTGEVHWVLQMIAKYQERAMETGARIVNCCGFDSIPSDLGVYYTQVQASKHFGRVCNDISMRVTKLKGSFSGGTYASLLNAVIDINNNSGLRKALASPYSLCPENHGFKARQRQHNGAAYDELTESWITPFVMEGVNTRIVHRSNALFDQEYGDEFKYDEALVTGKGRIGRKRATRTSFGLKTLMIGAVIPPIKALMERFFLPKPGEGPSQEEQEAGQYSLLFVGKVGGKGSIRCQVTGDKDPGYGSTAKMLAQAAICLAKDTPKGEPVGGFWTPARIFNDRLITRLEAHAGIHFSRLQSPS